MGMMGAVGEMVDSLLHHKPGDDWGSWKEILFWLAVLLLHGALIVFAAWRLAERHTDATGSSVLVPVKVKDPDLASASTTSLLPTTASRRRGAASSSLVI